MPVQYSYTYSTPDTATAWLAWTTVDSTSTSTDASTPYASSAHVWTTWQEPLRLGTQYTVQAYPTADYQIRPAETVEMNRDALRQARRLLFSELTATQRRMLHRRGYFTIRGSQGGIYRIHQGQVQNVVSVDERDQPRVRLCAHPSSRVPDEDAMLAQKLMLETDEEAFLEVANASSP